MYVFKGHYGGHEYLQGMWVLEIKVISYLYLFGAKLEVN
jgi:hypothetical protein